MDAHVGPLMPTQVTRVTAVSAPAVTFMATDLMDQTLTGVFMFLYPHYITEAYVVCLHTSNQAVLSILLRNGGPLKNRLKLYDICFS